MFNWVAAWDTAKAVGELAVTGAELYTSYKQYEAIEERQEIQERELRRKRELAAAQARREARVKKARLQFQQGQAGAVVSGTTAGIIGLDTTLESTIQDINIRTGFNIESSRIQEEAGKTAALGSAIGNLPTFAAQSKAFSDILFDTEEITNSDFGPYREGYKYG